MSKVKEEWLHQKAIVEWFKRQYAAKERLLIYVPNGSHNWGAHKGKIMNEMGLQKDFPDLQLMMARGGYHGLLLEVKRPKGVTTKTQKEYHEILRSEGYRVESCLGFEHGARIIKCYIAGEYAR